LGNLLMGYTIKNPPPPPPPARSLRTGAGGAASLSAVDVFLALLGVLGGSVGLALLVLRRLIPVKLLWRLRLFESGVGSSGLRRQKNASPSSPSHRFQFEV